VFNVRRQEKAAVGIVLKLVDEPVPKLQTIC
jgi:hypothetical protein